jgi:hypothetical protein
MELFGRDRVVVELWDHGDPLDSARNDALAELAARHDVACIATNNVHYATPSQRRLASAVARCAPGAASTSSTRGCRRRRRAPAQRRRAAAPLRPLPGRGRARGGDRPRRRRSTCRSSRRTSRRTRARRSTAAS